MKDKIREKLKNKNNQIKNEFVKRQEFLLEQKNEALTRMQKLHLLNQVITDFQNGKLNKSEYSYGVLYELDEEEKKRVKAFERQHNALVYHIIKNNTEYGVLYSYLYVSNQKKEWKQDREDIEIGTVFCYIENIDIPDYSEFGYIGIAPIYGGLRRLY